MFKHISSMPVTSAGEVIREHANAGGLPSLSAEMRDQFGWFKTPKTRTLTRLKDATVYKKWGGVDRHRIVIQEASWDRDAIAASDDYYAPPSWVNLRAGTVLTVTVNDTSKVEVELYEPSEDRQRVSELTMLINHIWHWNYAHMLFETLPRLRYTKDFSGLIAWDASPKAMEIAKLIGVEKSIVRHHEVTQYETLLVPSFWIGPDAMSWVRDVFSSNGAHGGSRIYVSRNDASQRRVINEQELTDILERYYGFTVVRSLSEKSLREQWELFASASIVVMPHGAACANMVFAPRHACLVEFVPRTYQHPLYKTLSEWQGQQYRCVVCEEDENLDMTVKVNEVKEALACFI